MPKQPLNFTGPTHLLAFLRGHATGQSVLHEAALTMCEGCRYAKRPVLVRLYSDGYVHALGEGVEIHIATVLHSEPLSASEEWAENYAAWWAPPKFRDLVTRAASAECSYKGRRSRFSSASELCRKRTRDDEMVRLQSLIFLRDLEAWRKRASAPSRDAHKT